jgi:two-component system sensor kinase FixL
MNTLAIWPEEIPGDTPKSKPPPIRWVVLLSLTTLALAVGATAWLYREGLNGLQAALVTGGAAGGFLIVTIVAMKRWQRELTNRCQKTIEEAGRVKQKYSSQMADNRILEEQGRKARMELEKKLASLTHAYATLEDEFNKRKQVEKSLAQQTQQLERSKDVLELHVQARAEELQKLQRRNELILNSAGEGICGLDLHGRTTFVNPAAAKITGWKVEELIGKTEQQIFFPADFREGKGNLEPVKDKDGEYSIEQVFQRKDGAPFIVEYVRTPIKENDRVVGAVIIFKDITERKRAEESLAQKAAELARSNAELEQFAFVASHDLQEPLRKIQSFGDRLKARCDASKLGEGRDYLDRMQNAAARMQKLIDDLLTFSRVISATQPFRSVDLGNIAREVLVDLEVLIEKTHAQVSVGDLPTIDADPSQIRQVLQNLIGNALKFQAPDAVPIVSIQAEMVDRQALLDAYPLKRLHGGNLDDQFCLLAVHDNGIGFDEQYLEKIFAVFQRLHGRGEYEGTGVGLAVCRRITDRHGGAITARSRPGEGATFVVILPAQHPKTEATE